MLELPYIIRHFHGILSLAGSIHLRNDAVNQAGTESDVRPSRWNVVKMPSSTVALPPIVFSHPFPISVATQSPTAAPETILSNLAGVSMRFLHRRTPTSNILARHASLQLCKSALHLVNACPRRFALFRDDQPPLFVEFLRAQDRTSLRKVGVALARLKVSDE